jgi:ABC-type amino acid transport system permease subunit
MDSARQSSAIIYDSQFFKIVIVVFLVVVVFAMGILTYTQNTVRQTKSDEMRSEAYYYSRTGVEIISDQLLDIFENVTFVASVGAGDDNQFFPGEEGEYTHTLKFVYNSVPGDTI